MSSFFATTGPSETDSAQVSAVVVNPWKIALGALAGVLVLGGVITVAVGLSTVGRFQDTVLGASAEFDQGVAVAIVGGAAILLGVVVGTCWLVLGALAHDRRG